MKWIKDVHDLRHKDIYCNVCGRKLVMEHGILKEDVFSAKKEWGYFSHKDLQIHRFNMCERCYNKMVSQFVIPVDVALKKEVM